MLINPEIKRLHDMVLEKQSERALYFRDFF